MAAGNSMGDRYRIARLAAANNTQSLSTYAGAAEAIGVESPDTIGRWERDESTPSNFNVKQMALVYRAPELMPNYCATSCPIGQGRVKEITINPIEQTAIQLYNSGRGLDQAISTLMEIAEDGVIDETERVRFNQIIQQLGKLSDTINTLKLIAEKMDYKGA